MHLNFIVAVCLQQYARLIYLNAYYGHLNWHQNSLIVMSTKLGLDLDFILLVHIFIISSHSVQKIVFIIPISSRIPI